MKYPRQIITLLLLLAYAGQSLAAVGAPCFMSASSPGEISTDVAAMDHSAHHMNSTDQADNAAEGCCEGGGFCSMSHCQSAAAVPGTVVAIPPHCFTDYRNVAGFSSCSNPLESLYRPPIFS